MRVRVIGLAFGLLLVAAPAFAQQISVDINKARLAWDAPTTGGPPDVYHVKCGDATGNYNHPVVDVAAPNAQIEIKLVVPTLGEYFCVVSAENTFGVSGDSNEINFTAGATPGNPTNLSVVAQ